MKCQFCNKEAVRLFLHARVCDECYNKVFLTIWMYKLRNDQQKKTNKEGKR